MDKEAESSLNVTLSHIAHVANVLYMHAAIFHIPNAIRYLLMFHNFASLKSVNDMPSY